MGQGRKLLDEAPQEQWRVVGRFSQPHGLLTLASFLNPIEVNGVFDKATHVAKGYVAHRGASSSIWGWGPL